MKRRLPSFRSLLSAFFLAGLVAGFCRFAPDAIRSTHMSSGFASWRKTVSRTLPGQVPQHDRLVVAAGLFARLAGWRLFNGAVRLENGMLGRETGRFADPLRLADEIEREVSMRKIPYLFALAPCKMDLDKTLMPTGLRCSANEVGGCFLERLAARGVGTLDLRGAFVATPADVERNFFRADTHWNLLAAWRAAARVSARVAALTGDSADGVRDAFAEEAWKTCRADRPWSGYMAKRAGPHFGGMDAVAWRVPRRVVDMRRIEADGEQTRGVFHDVVVERDEKLGYAWGGVVGGRSRSPVVYENEDAPSDRTVLVLKDSFGRSVAAYLSAGFRRVVAVDPRLLPSGRKVGDLIRETNPDVVLELVNAELVLSQASAFSERRRGYFCWD